MITRTAAIDIGTNSTRLLIADFNHKENQLCEVTRTSTVTRLGEQVDQTNLLQLQAKQRVLEALQSYQKLIQTHRVQHTHAVLTSAARDAENGELFAKEITEKTGFPAQVISEDQEMAYTARGAAGSCKTPVQVIDIGGGSTEIILATAGKVNWGISLPLGVIRSTERHLRNDPPTQQELTELKTEARELITQSLSTQRQPTEQVQTYAVAGTPTSAAAIAQSLEPYDRKRVHGFLLQLSTCERQRDALAKLPLKERAHTPGLHPDRAAMIVTGLTILCEVLSVLRISKFTVSEQDLLYGLAQQNAIDTYSAVETIQ